MLINSVNFETGDLSQCLGSAGGASVVGTVAIWGKFSLQLRRNASPGYAVIGASPTTSFNLPTAFYRWYFMYSQKATAGNHTGICNFQDTAQSYKAAIHLDSNGHLQFFDRNGTLISTGTTTLQPGVVYALSAKIGTGASAAWELRVNGVVELSGTSDVTSGNNGSIKLGGGANYTDTFYFDEIAVDDAAYPAPVTTPPAGTPVGTVALTMDGISQGSQALNAQGVASFTIHSPAPGTHPLVATFTSTNFAGKTGNATLTVSGGASTKTSQATDNLGLTDNVQRYVSWSKKVSAQGDVLGLTDSVTVIHQVPKNPKVFDSLGLSELLTTSVPFWHRSVPENLGVSDTLSSAHGFANKVADNLGITDLLTIAKTTYGVRFLFDILGISDQIAIGVTHSFNRTVSDNLGLTDRITVYATSGKILGIKDNLGLTDAVTTAVSYVRSPTVSDNLGLSDSAQRLTAALRLVSDSVGLSDSLTTRLGPGRGVSENLGLTDSITTFTPGRPRLSDNAGLTDQVFVLTSSSRRFADNLGVSDNAVAGLRALLGITANWRVDTPISRWRQDSPVTGQDWYIVRGEDKAIYVVSDAGPINIKGWSLRWQLRPFDGPVPIAVTIDTNNGLLVIDDAKNGLMQINLRSWHTVNRIILPTPWYWELIRFDAGFHASLARGTLTIDVENATP